MSSQNIYDNTEFFEGYGRMPRSVEGLAGAAEWAAMRALLPDLHGRRVLDLGCGFGWFCRWAREHGAAQVVGIDVSENMLARARSTTSEGAVTYQRADLERIDLPEAALIGVEPAGTSLCRRLFRSDGEGASHAEAEGTSGFFIEHPVFMAPEHPEWFMDAKGSRVWPVSRPWRRLSTPPAARPRVTGRSS